MDSDFFFFCILTKGKYNKIKRYLCNTENVYIQCYIENFLIICLLSWVLTSIYQHKEGNNLFFLYIDVPDYSLEIVIDLPNGNNNLIMPLIEIFQLINCV